jgi:beta-phosphoglucomutase-like phosphatase (HAD superfamily)
VAEARDLRAGTVARAVVFDLDGTLVETEELKALSYARAAISLRPGQVDPSEVVDAYRPLAGRAREEVAQSLLARFALEAPAARLMGELGATTPWQAYLLVRVRVYEAMLGDVALIRRQEYTHATSLLRRLRRARVPTALATMSYLSQVERILAALGLQREFDAVVTRDDVRRSKPDPEIYVAAASRLGLAPASCLVIEDSLPGVQAALAAGASCVAVGTSLTRDALHTGGVSPPARILDDPARLGPVVLTLLAEPAAGVVPQEPTRE